MTNNDISHCECDQKNIAIVEPYFSGSHSQLIHTLLDGMYYLINNYTYYIIFIIIIYLLYCYYTYSTLVHYQTINLIIIILKGSISIKKAKSMGLICFNYRLVISL